MANTNIYDMAQTWNNADVDFDAILMDVTDTASDDASNLLRLQIGGSDIIRFQKDGFFEQSTAPGGKVQENLLRGSANGGYSFGMYQASAPWTNGPTGDKNYYDDVWCFGLNVGGVGVKKDAAKQYMALHMESKWYASSADGASPNSEFHLQIVDLDGIAHRPISGAFHHDGEYGELSLGATILSLNNYAAGQQIKLDFSNTDPIISHVNKSVIRFQGNNYAPLRQRNAANNADLSLPWFDGDDRLRLQAPFVVVGATPTVGTYQNTFFEIQATSVPTNGRVLALWSSSTITGPATLLQIDGACTGDQMLGLYNSDQTSTANSMLDLRVASTAAGDAKVRYAVLGGGVWHVGLDNSNADAFVWSTSTLGAADKMILDTSGNLKVVGSMTIQSLPTSDPAVAGALWNNSGVVNVSAG